MLSAGEVQRRLADGAAAALGMDDAGLAGAHEWLGVATAAELLHADGLARTWRWDQPLLGPAASWTDEVLAQPAVVAAVLGSMHGDGRVRQRAVRRLASASDPLARRALAVRLSDHVPPIREAAARSVLQMDTLESALAVFPVLELVRGRARAGDVRTLYLRGLVDVHGEQQVWSALRESADRDLRRMAFRHSIDQGLVGVGDAAARLADEKDQVVRGLLSGVVADHGSVRDVVEVLFKVGSAEGRARGLVRLEAEQIGPPVLAELLLDSSVLVRLWARRRWSELGRDAQSTYLGVARSDATPRRRARAYTGLVESGGDINHDEAVQLTRTGVPALVRVGLGRLVDTAEPEDVSDLFAVVRSGSSKEARLASEALVGLRRHWQLVDLDELVSSPEPAQRRRAWWLHRSLGGWEQTIADLLVSADPDHDLSSLGLSARSPMYGQPTEEQRQRLVALLETADLPVSRLLDVAVAGGVRDIMRERRPELSLRDAVGRGSAPQRRVVEPVRLPTPQQRERGWFGRLWSTISRTRG